MYIHNFLGGVDLNISPAINPIIPNVIICHGVHIPWPRKKLDVNADKVPVKKPNFGPKHIPEIIIIADIGFTWGSIENKILLVAAIDDNTEAKINDLELILLFSNDKKKNTISNIIVRRHSI